jgi:Outer membrane cobalamin receptor protein
MNRFVLLVVLISSSLLLVISTSEEVVAQSITDTVFQMSEVVVTASRNQHFGNNFKTEVFTRDELGAYAGESLSRFLTSNTALNVKAYGVGGALANITLRGTATSHVQVNWNGFPINSATLGSCDISMIPAGGFNQVSVVYGASGAVYGSGTFGGAINLDSYVKPEKSFSGSAQLGYQSLKAVDGSATLHIGNNKVACQISAWGAKSDNEFTYYDYINLNNRTQTDGAWNDAGVIQNIVMKLTPASTLEVGLWYQVKKYNIPSHVGSTSYETQKDSTLKLFVAYKTHGNRWGLQVKSAMFDDYQHYWQKASAQSSINSIDSHISATQWYSDANFRYYIKNYLSIDAGVTGSYISADVSAYGDIKKEKGLATFIGLKYDKHRWSWQTALRKEWNSDFHSNILASFGASWQVIPDNWILRANASQKFRKPTFNDLYWIPGGNPNLKPETGYSAEIGSLATIWKNTQAKLSTDLSLYWSQVRDMIVWRPAGAYWEAMNYQRMYSTGMEAKLLFDIQRLHRKYHSSLMVTLNRSMAQTNADTQEKVMIYSPKIITAWENQISAGIMDFTVWHHFTADRFYDDNALLKPYQTIDVQVGAKIPVTKQNKLGIHATVYNLTNTRYELIRLYPMPGRYWSVKMSCTF